MTKTIEDLPGEEWKPVVGYEGLYEVSNMGRLRACEKSTTWITRWGTPATTTFPAQAMSPHQGYYGYAYIMLYKGGKAKMKRVHTLVLDAFVRPRRRGEVCRHLNGVFDDNRLANLKWGTVRENAQDAIEHGGVWRGSQMPHAKLDEARVAEIKQLLADGHVQAEIAKQYGVCRQTITNIKYGRSWAHVS